MIQVSWYVISGLKIPFSHSMRLKLENVTREKYLEILALKIPFSHSMRLKPPSGHAVITYGYA